MPLKDSIDFLKQFHPKGLWVLTCIQPDRQGIETVTFHPQGTTEKALMDWLKKWNGERNIYFQVNQPIQELSKKASRNDIKELNYLHVDVDPPKVIKSTIEIEQEKILKQLTTEFPEDLPRPTCLLFSGGGYQAFWRLKNPVPIDGDLKKAEDLKLFNIQLERVFRGDDCHNIDRIMRLPGTMNIPSPKKIKAGRKKVEAKLLWLEDTAYELSQFIKFQETQSTSKGSYEEDTTLKIDGEVQRLKDIHDLDEWSVNDRTKIIIVQGSHPDSEEIAKKEKEGKDTSRSAWLFDVCCSLSRCEVPPETIYSIITDPNFAISDSVIERPDWDRYARRQIERSIQNAIDPDLQKFNDRYAVILHYGNKCRIHHEYFDEPTDSMVSVFTDVTSFKQGYCNQIKTTMSDNGKPRFEKLGDWWFNNAQRRQYERVVFYPGKTIPNCLNLWKGYACESNPLGCCDLFLSHLKDIVCGGVDEYYDYFIKWLANLVQYPATAGQVAIVLRGAQGVGKGIIGKIIGSLFGRHYKYVSDPKHLIGSFNAHLRDCVFLFADEAFFAGDKKHESNLKAIITENIRTIEAKGVDAEQAPNFLHIMMASNSEWVVPAGADDRRFFVLDVKDTYKQNPEYFSPIFDQLAKDGKEKLLHHLMTMDLTDFDVRKAPKTDALKEQKSYSYSVEQAWWLTKLDQGSVYGEGIWPDRVMKMRLYTDYLDTCESMRVYRPMNQIAFGRMFIRLTGGLVDATKLLFIQTDDGRKTAYELPKLAELREAWDRIYAPYDWPKEPDIMEIIQQEDDQF
jgi:hypothetical protein